MHGCDLIGIARSTLRYRTLQAEEEVELTAMIRDYAHHHPQYGYRLITGLLLADGMVVNHKRVERIWRREGLQQPKRAACKRHYGEGGDVKQRATHINHIWSYDFTEDRTESGQRLRILAVMDEFTRQCPMLYASTSIPSTVKDEMSSDTSDLAVNCLNHLARCVKSIDIPHFVLQPPIEGLDVAVLPRSCHLTN